jgi:hypothetical protein
MENKKKVGLIVTIVTIFLCACPGLCAILYGAVFSQGYAMEDYGFDVTGDPQAFTYFGIASICIGVIGLLIPLGAGIYTIVQNRKGKQVEEITDIPDPLSGE